MENNNALQKQETSMSERFASMVIKEFGANAAGVPQVTDYQRNLISGYFIGIDKALKQAEEGRQRKNSNNKDPKYNENLPVTWANVNLTDLALNVMHHARMGLDMMSNNHLFPIPFKNNKTNKYDVNLMPGYNGIKYVAEKYALDKPQAVTIELVYSTDTFKPIKKNNVNKVETYDFEINNPFDRGEIIGGFGYLEYEHAEKNKLIIMSIKEILKRKPGHAAAEFWGGTTKVWEKGKQVEKEIDGWYEQMCLKTLIREVYSAKHMPRDPKLIDDNYQFMRQQEAHLAAQEAEQEAGAYANRVVIDTSADWVEEPTEEMAAQLIETVPSNAIPADPETGEVVAEAPVADDPTPLEGIAF